MPSAGPLPPRFTIDRDASGAVELSWRWKRPAVLSFLLFLFCCPGSCGMYGQALVDGTVAITEGGGRGRTGRVVGHAKVPWLGYLMMAVAILFTAAILCLLLIALLNRTTLRAERGRLRVRHSPIPLPRTDLRASDIAGFEHRLSPRSERMRESQRRRASSSRARPDAGQEAPSEYRLYAYNHQGTRYRLVDELETPEQCAWVERELRRALGMRDETPAEGNG